jgi:hypothetical protein
MPSFSNKKYLKVVVTLGTDKFGSSEYNTITLQGFRTSIYIDKAGGVQMSSLRARVYGVRQDDMNSITTLQWRPKLLVPNTVEVYALEDDVETLIFAGNIINAWGNYHTMPDVFLEIQAQAAFFARLKPVAPRSFKGVMDVPSVMGQIARDLGYAFENNGVTTKMRDIYLAGTGLDQAKELAQMSRIAMYVDDKVLAIAPQDQPRAGLIPLISPATGMIGYPTFDGVGVNFQTLFNPAIRFGGSIKLETDISQAAGEWVVTSVAHQLDSEMPHGRWFSYVRGNINGLAVTRR